MSNWNTIESVPEDTIVDLWAGNRRYADCQIVDKRRVQIFPAYVTDPTEYLGFMPKRFELGADFKPTHWCRAEGPL